MAGVYGAFNADEVTGKENPDAMDYTQSIASGVLSGLTLGLVDHQTMYNLTNGAADWLADEVFTNEGEKRRMQEIAEAQRAQRDAGIQASMSALAIQQRSDIDAILARQNSGEELSEDEQDKLNMYERDENGNIKTDENGDYVISKEGMAKYTQKAQSRSLTGTLGESMQTLRDRVKTTGDILNQKRAAVREHIGGIQGTIVGYKDKRSSSTSFS